MVVGKAKAVIRGDLARSHRYQRALFWHKVADHIDQIRIVFTLDVELDARVVAAQVVGDQGYVRELDVTLIHTRMHRDAMGSGTDTSIDRAQQIGFVTSSRISQKGVFINVDG